MSARPLDLYTETCINEFGIRANEVGKRHMKRQDIGENLVCQVWRGQQLVKGPLIASNGQVQVVYPGRANDDSGPDFRDAIITTAAGSSLRGDIELHVRASDWRAHGHHRDPRFNKVILHVVMWDDTRKPTPLQNGETAPVLALEEYLEGSLEDLSQQAKLVPAFFEPCHTSLERRGAVKVESVLEELGGERLQAKAALFERALTMGKPVQVLYEGIMEALGYNKNKEPFRELAHRLPLPAIAEAVRDKRQPRQILVAQSLLFGMAGLLPSQRQGKAVNREALKLVEEMEEIWSSFGLQEGMNEGDWSFFRVRPDNFPSRRLAGAGHLVIRYIEKGSVENLLELVTREELRRASEKLGQALVVTDSGYWGKHIDLVGEVRTQNPSLIGSGRAKDIVINIVLPFSYAYAKVTSNSRLANQALEIYQRHPRLDDNNVTREMKEKLFSSRGQKFSSSAQRQQGLIHLFKTFCLEHRCSECPLT